MVISEDHQPLSLAEFNKRYPGYLDKHCDWRTLRRLRHKNGLVEKGVLIERPGKARQHVRIVPALLHAHFTGERPIRQARDMWLEEMKAQNQRLMSLESRLEALTRILSSG